MKEKNRFSSLLKHLMTIANLKNYTLAKELQYDHNGGKQAHTYEVFRFIIQFRFLLAVPPPEVDGMQNMIDQKSSGTPSISASRSSNAIC